LGRVLASWIDPQANFPVTRFLHEITEPILGPIRSIMPNIGMFDFSPIVAMLVLQLLEQLIISAIR
ncbi:MAG: YggT family protein, partial [Chloroflexi bacterium]